MLQVENEKEYRSYMLRGLPAGAFGETYIITAGIIESENSYHCEFFMVSKRHQPSLYVGTVSFESTSTPEELLKIDVEFLEREAKQQAENYVIGSLFEIAEKNSKPNLLDCRFELQEIKYMPLHGCWFRGDFHEEIKEILQKTRCAGLKGYLGVLTKSSYIQK